MLSPHTKNNKSLFKNSLLAFQRSGPETNNNLSAGNPPGGDSASKIAVKGKYGINPFPIEDIYSEKRFAIERTAREKIAEIFNQAMLAALNDKDTQIQPNDPYNLSVYQSPPSNDPRIQKVYIGIQTAILTWYKAQSPDTKS